MKHPKTMNVDHAAIVEAVQMWIDAKFAEAERPKVDRVSKLTKQYSHEPEGFEITFLDGVPS